MWNGRHPSENGDDGRTEQGGDPARYAAVSALAAFTQQGPYASQPPNARAYAPNAPPQASYRGSGATALPIDPSLGYQDQALRQQAMYSYPPQHAHPQHAHSIMQQHQQHQPPQYSREDLEYQRQMAARHEAEQYHRSYEQPQPQRWGPPNTNGDAPPHARAMERYHSGAAGSEPDMDGYSTRGNGASRSARAPSNGHANGAAENGHGQVLDRDEDEDEDDSMDDAQDESPKAPEVVVPKPRGKPEAMAVKLAAAALEEAREELEAEVVTEPVGDDAGQVLVTVDKPRPKRSRSVPKKPKKKASPPSQQRSELLLSETAPGISDEEYENLEALMIQFCRVPLLAEFSRPVTLLHPELVAAYTKIVTNPVDLGHVCRGIRRRQYKNTRDVRLVMWRVFANCVKFHSHPNNDEAVPSFVSIALHLREFFNYLWQEYMLPSDPLEGATDVQRQSFVRREGDRKKRFENLRLLTMNKNAIYGMATALGRFVEGGGIVDKLDKEPVFGEECIESDRDLDVVVENLKQFQVKLEERSLAAEEEYFIGDFLLDLKRCYQHEVLEDNPSLRMRIGYRLNRFTGKFFVPLCEANSRGVTQSSIWGNLAAVIWARESSKKPYWPALCLGMLPPEDQREGWHAAVTDRNELRLPEKLRAALMTAKKRCEQGQKRQNLSYFLVEFLGTHEFIWVRETDIIEKFDPKEDPNKSVAPKKKRASRSSSTSVTSSKTYAKALEECGWANEEFEMTLTEAFEDIFNENAGADDDDGEEMNYSYGILAQSDDEADDEDEHGFKYEEATMSLSDIDEANWLITHEGQLDTSAAGRKNAKKRTQAMKKRTAEKEKKVHTDTTKGSKEKSKGAPAKKKKDSRTKGREEKREMRDLEKRRRKRQREREKVLRSEFRKQKRRRTLSFESDVDDRGLHRDKRARATAIVKAYLTRAVKKVEYKSLGLAGVMQIPAAIVDSTGLLGMALAFRAAAGEMAMPDDTDETKTKPWKAIDVDGPKTSAERTESLKKKIKLLEDELQRVQTNSQKRQELTQEAVASQTATESEVVADDIAARLNHFKKKKKTSPKADRTPVDDSHSERATLKESGSKEEAVETNEPVDDAGEANSPQVTAVVALAEADIHNDDAIEETTDAEPIDIPMEDSYVVD